MITRDSIALRHARMFDRHNRTSFIEVASRLALGLVVIGSIFGSLYFWAGA